jgi:hypothetical protein
MDEVGGANSGAQMGHCHPGPPHACTGNRGQARQADAIQTIELHLRLEVAPEIVTASAEVNQNWMRMPIV